MTKKQIKEIFKRNHVQIGKEVMPMIERELVDHVKLMCVRLTHGNVKRLTPELFWVAIGGDPKERTNRAI